MRQYAPVPSGSRRIPAVELDGDRAWRRNGLHAGRPGYRRSEEWSVLGIGTGTLAVKPFWGASAGPRPYSVSPEVPANSVLRRRAKDAQDAPVRRNVGLKADWSRSLQRQRPSWPTQMYLADRRSCEPRILNHPDGVVSTSERSGQADSEIKVLARTSDSQLPKLVSSPLESRGAATRRVFDRAGRSGDERGVGSACYDKSDGGGSAVWGSWVSTSLTFVSIGSALKLGQTNQRRRRDTRPLKHLAQRGCSRFSCRARTLRRPISARMFVADVSKVSEPDTQLGE